MYELCQESSQIAMLNLGSSFGLFPNLPILIYLMVLIGLLVVAVKMREFWGRIGILLIIVGGGGNLVSRVQNGGVVDNWNFFGIFYNNVWDYLIFVGILVYIIQAFRHKI